MIIDILGRVAALVERETGIVLGVAQLASLEAAIARVAPGMTPERLLSPETSAATLERLIDEITVRETFFFRHRRELDTIDWHGALRAARARGTEAIRVWIAGCASGEEAYTIAILACEALGSSVPPVRILATDIAPTAIAEARRGRYGGRAVRTLDEDVRRRYFRSENGTLCVDDRLLGLVDVRHHNLVRDRIPPLGSPPFDLIVCRNVLIYFDEETVDRLVASFRGALWPSGRLLLGAADRISGQRRQVTIAKPQGLPNLGRPTSARGAPRGARPQAADRPAAGVRAQAATDRTRSDAGSPAGSRAGDRGPHLARALQAADRGDLDTALKIAGDALAEDPLDAEAHFITGVAELARKAPQAAVDSLRRALYADPTSSLAAFQLARAHDALGERVPARRAYEQALRTLELNSEDRSFAEAQDFADITAACRSRLQALAVES